MSSRLGSTVRRHGSGSARRSSSSRPASPNRQIRDRTRVPEGHQCRVDAVLERRAVTDQMQAEPSRLALATDRRVGQPDRRKRGCARTARPNARVDVVGLAGQGREAVDLLRVGDQDVPPELFERVVHEPRTGHRLDHCAHRRVFEATARAAIVALRELARILPACRRPGDNPAGSRFGAKQPPEKSAAHGRSARGLPHVVRALANSEPATYGLATPSSSITRSEIARPAAWLFSGVKWMPSTPSVLRNSPRFRKSAPASLATAA
jgi:hypothetical protein